jgi:hypothetical protein
MLRKPFQRTFRIPRCGPNSPSNRRFVSLWVPAITLTKASRGM